MSASRREIFFKAASWVHHVGKYFSETFNRFQRFDPTCYEVIKYRKHAQERHFSRINFGPELFVDKTGIHNVFKKSVIVIFFSTINYHFFQLFLLCSIYPTNYRQPMLLGKSSIFILQRNFLNWHFLKCQSCFKIYLSFNFFGLHINLITFWLEVQLSSKVGFALFLLKKRKEEKRMKEKRRNM